VRGVNEPLPPDALLAWRHPKPRGAEGRCIGAGTDLPVDPRRARRGPRRIQREARRHGLPRIVVTSPLRRCADVGRWLRRWGWSHRIDPGLAELHFGRWEGRAWASIARAEVDAWCEDFCTSRPGGGDSLEAMLERAGGWMPGPARVLVGHAGWLLARRWCEEQGGGGRRPTAAEWPAAPPYGGLYLVKMSLPVPVRRSR
jgi:alpha-ribazole phosphatase